MIELNVVIHTCALVPPIPNELTLILSHLPAGQGVGSTGTCNFASLKGTEDKE